MVGKKLFWTVLVSVLLLKIFILVLFPILGDEAYYFTWAQHPAGGYYDIAPMIAWWLYPYTKLNLPSEWFRILMVIAHLGVAWMIASVCGKWSRFVFLVNLIAPLLIVNVILIADWPLAFFYCAAGVVFFLADQERSQRKSMLLAFASGLLLGLAFLSKYFAVTFFPSALVYLLFTKKDLKRSVLLLVTLGIGFLPGIAQHFFWNQENCFKTIQFNLFTRQNAYDGTFANTFGHYWLYVLALVGPAPLFFSKKFFLKSQDAVNPIERFALVQFLVPMALFCVSAISKGQGIHWYMSYQPWFWTWVALRLARLDLVSLKAKIGLFLWPSIQAVAAITLLVLPIEKLRPSIGERSWRDLVLTTSRDRVAKLISDQPPVSAVISDNYSYASVLSVAFKESGIHLPVGVFGPGVRFGRSFDAWMDWPSLDGKDMLWIGRAFPPELAGSFQSVEMIDPKGIPIAILRGHGFIAQKYLQQYGADILQNYYKKFSWERACATRHYLGAE